MQLGNTFHRFVTGLLFGWLSGALFPAAADDGWQLADEIPLEDLDGALTAHAAGFAYVPPAVLLRPSATQLWVVMAVPTKTVGDDGTGRWRIAFALDDERVVVGQRLGGSAGQDEVGAVDATVYGLPDGESPERVVAVRVEAPTGAPALARIAEANRAFAERKARVAALRDRVTLPRAELGKPFPFGLALLDGGQLDSAATRGRPLLIEVWGTWCTPCIRSARDLAALQVRVGSERLALLGLSLDGDPEAVRRFVATHGADWPQHVVGDEELGQATLDVLGLVGVPHYLLLDADGIVRHIGRGPVADQQFERRLAEIEARHR